ncbi:substrate-binding domain-containing protein [Solirubrobacter ginsenosidimutans]|uniref:substrate-binding domain-containing protein n=1 Tax=Solirubrobacter ginsenosidimutans TaxID=490573 RepID=UPI0022CDC0D3|nr:substrate-binding domain-containing protein [Solirubrobacter ginsenosidimutans]
MRITRGLSVAAMALALGGTVAACGSHDNSTSGSIQTTKTAPASSPAADTGPPVHLAFSAPAADHGWLKAVTDDAKAEAKQLGITMDVQDSASTSAEQADQIQTLIASKPDALVVLPNEGEALTPAAEQATKAGIPVINIDRAFTTPAADRLWIGGDNYGIGWQAGNYFADQLNCKGNVVEIQGLAGISVTQDRTKGFADALKQRCQGGIKIVANQPADFLPDKGLSVMENILQAQKHIDAVYTQDDDMAQGVAAAIQNAHRDKEMWMTGAGGSKQVMEEIQKGGLWRATFLYNPSMAASAVHLAQLIVQQKGLDELAEPEIPSSITLQATAVTKDNVAKYLKLGF